jgi:hypothetical protein
MKLLDDLTDLATITVTLSLPPVVIEPPDTQTEPGWARDAWDNAWQKSQKVIETLGAAAIVAGVILVWVLVPAVMLGIAWRVVSIIGRRGGISIAHFPAGERYEPLPGPSAIGPCLGRRRCSP